MTTAQSLMPFSSTDWFPVGMPASASRSIASRAFGCWTSKGWLKWVLSQMGWYFRSMFTSSGVMRCGSTTGMRVPMRMISTCGIARRFLMTYSSRRSGTASGSPPEIRTSRISGCARM